MSWYLTQLKPNCAWIAEKNLNRQGFETFLPLEEATTERRGKFVTNVQPLFPGYIFVRLDVSKGSWRSVNSTYGVTRLVSFGAAPAPVPHQLVDSIQSRCDDTGKLLPPDKLKPGDKVSLASGPLAHFIAHIDEILPDQRVWVLLDIMGGQTRVKVDARQLRLA